ncbi:UvrD-helicase domain-containing protein [uncultured Fusobacterium sp.]|uniref:UvrD-helicase domain-containing protein n=1 Tax=uncultured Fusobacterium sp. TaxID=159267 RepID=UPI0025DC4CEF|nr:UvrD-helicase domain-containing protein [uncultured Fusobacterium sp.]
MGLPITSNSEIKIGNHFKITAGPGAGKTTFLINNIKNIFKNSDKISIYRKIACITYTNIAVENILKN